MYNLIKKINDNFNLTSTRLTSTRIERKIKVYKYQTEFIKDNFYKIGFNNQYPDQFIESIYFDDQYLNFARSNINGELYRIKPRFRWYNDDLSKVNHEFKIKNGFNGYKSINNHLYKNLKSKNEMILATKKFYREFLNISLNEVVSVRYLRTYLNHPSGIRITVDRDIKASLLKNNIYYAMPFEVIEFKYNNNLDSFFRNSIFNQLNRLPIRLTKCSKYVESVIRLI